MRLHQLTVTAFGSFGGTETVDFDRLSSSGLFLLHGPTGAGKTTLLDAVSFALFGKVPGVRVAGEGLRSDHATDGLPTEVRLEVTLGGRRYRIMRQPKQLLPKQRGDGTREHGAKATIEELVDGEWLARASRPSEADPMLAEHLHMGADQFHQIVMLPQGDFADFLRAKPADREKLLENLFGTSHFAQVQAWLKSQAQAARSAVAEGEADVRLDLAHGAAIAGCDRFDDGADLAASLLWLTHLVDQAVAHAAHTLTAAESAAQERIRASDHLDQVAITHELQGRHHRASQRLDQLQARAVEHRDATERLDRARRAAVLEPLVAANVEAQSDFQRAQTTHRRAQRRLEAHHAEHPGGPDDDLPPTDHGFLVLRTEELAVQLSTLNELMADEQMLRDRQSELASLDDEVARLSARVDTASTELRSMPDQLDGVARQLTTAREALQRCDALSAEVDRSRVRHQAARRRDELNDLVEAAQHTRRQRRDDDLDTKAAWLELLRRQLDQRAALLAEHLNDGDACPVCGSVEHPAPASGGPDELVTDDRVDAAHRFHDRATMRLAEVATELGTLEQQLSAAAAQAGDTSVTDLAVLVASATTQLQSAQIDAEQVPGLESQLERIEARRQRLTTGIDGAAQQLTALSERRGAVNASVSDGRRRVATATAGFASVHERHRVLTHERAVIDGLLVAHHQLDTALNEVARSLEAAAAQSRRSGFDDLESATAAIVAPNQLEQLATRVDAHEEQLQAVEAELADSRVSAAALCPPADLEGATARSATADTAWSIAVSNSSAAESASAALAQTLATVEQRMRSLAPLAADYAVKHRIAELASGDDRQAAHRMSLSTYVLAARLEQVAIVASERLSRMSNGRYTLIYCDEAVDGRQRAGLGLRIVDSWTSTQRQTTTLSGGESFFASLSLALAVADVVAAEAGGVHLDTIFIDEGFGSLDEATLEDVMDVLDGLRCGGRTVGIVSHVADLRNRITTQLELSKGPDGSTIRALVG